MEKIINNRFRELKTISESAMGNVCIAYDTRDEQNIALKFLCHEFHKDEEMLTRFRLEFNTLMKLRHSNLASVFEFGTSEDGLPFFTMEFIDGEQINKLDFELKKVYSYLKQICTAIRYIHSHGIIHGDIKSSNILVTKTGNVKILDFGLAQRINEFEANSISGTIEYLPPEVLKGQAVSFQTDLYSFGVVLYEILTNELPYKNDDLFSEFFGKLTNPIKSPTEKNKIIPQELSNVVLKLIERDASGRYQTINEVIEDLNKFLTEKIPYEEQSTFYALNKHFVSRKDQLNTLKIIHSGAKTGTGKSVLLVGKNGIGKTRLLKEFEFFTSLGEGKVVYQNFPENTEPGFRNWLPILKKCFDKFATKEEINEFGKIFVKFLPELAELYQLPLQNFQTKEQLEFFNSLVEFFFRISRNKTFLLILDDVQFASPTNLKLLDFLVKKCTKTCVMICFATSDETQFYTVFNENIIKLEISGFNFSETATFIASKLGLKGEPIEFGKRLFEETNGSLLYIEE
ncbi:serine/threonine-protein kinase PknK, partial [bacterium]|nr:serine/threonine-protein kinase PknK [bacterium]